MYRFFALGLAVAVTPGVAANEPWLDTFYQYRIPIEVEVDQIGWALVPLTAAAVVEAVNGIEEMPLDDRWFDFNRVKIVEWDEVSQTSRELQAGFHLVPQSENLVDPQLLGRQDSVEIPVESGAYYLLRYTAEGAGRSPAHRYYPTFPIGHRLRRDANFMSYEPKMLPLQPAERERLILSDGQPLELELGGRFVRGLQSISLQKVEIAFLARVDRPGVRHWTLYYQPNNGHHLSLPDLRAAELPPSSVRSARLGAAEKYLGNTRYGLPSCGDLAIWFAETTVKLTPATRQYDRLVLDFYRTIAQNLEQHGWLDYAYILMDETARRGYEPLLHFLRLLKSDPLTARIRVAWCLQGAEAYRYRSQSDQDYAFKDLIGIYVPETNENHHWWEKYYFSDYGVEPRREKLWNYVTYTTRVAMTRRVSTIGRSPWKSSTMEAAAFSIGRLSSGIPGIMPRC